MSITKDNETVAIYHVMKAHEDFEHAARALFEMVRSAEQKWPGADRHVYLDVDEHRTEGGGFDTDAYELLGNYALGFIGPFVTKVVTPLGEFIAEGPQWDDVPEELIMTTPTDDTEPEGEPHVEAHETRGIAPKAAGEDPADVRDVEDLPSL